jgi:hypothetical protein
LQQLATEQAREARQSAGAATVTGILGMSETAQLAAPSAGPPLPQQLSSVSETTRHLLAAQAMAERGYDGFYLLF